MWSNGLGQNRGTDEEYDGDCVEEEFRLARAKLRKYGKGDRKPLGMGNGSINI